MMHFDGEIWIWPIIQIAIHSLCCVSQVFKTLIWHAIAGNLNYLVDMFILGVSLIYFNFLAHLYWLFPFCCRWCMQLCQCTRLISDEGLLGSFILSEPCSTKSQQQLCVRATSDNNKSDVAFLVFFVQHLRPSVRSVISYLKSIACIQLCETVFCLPISVSICRYLLVHTGVVREKGEKNTQGESTSN